MRMLTSFSSSSASYSAVGLSASAASSPLMASPTSWLAVCCLLCLVSFDYICADAVSEVNRHALSIIQVRIHVCVNAQHCTMHNCTCMIMHAFCRFICICV